MTSRQAGNGQTKETTTMDLMTQLVRDRTEALRRVADDVRRERELRSTSRATPRATPELSCDAATRSRPDPCDQPCLQRMAGQSA